MSENMRIAYTSENKIYLLENGNKTEIPCGRIIKYKEALDSIRRRTEWKTTGSGAQFMGMAENGAPDEENITARISGLSFDGERLIYAVRLDGSAALYQRSTDRKDMNEGLILSGNSFTFGAVDSLEGKLAVSMGSSVNDLHIAVMEPPSSTGTRWRRIRGSAGTKRDGYIFQRLEMPATSTAQWERYLPEAEHT